MFRWLVRWNDGDRKRVVLGFWRLRLQTVEKIRRPLRVRGGAEDRPVVLFEDGEPIADVGGMILADFRGDAKGCAKESGSQFGHEFFVRVNAVAEGFAKFTVQSRAVPGPVSQFVEERSIIGFFANEALEWRHLNDIA